MNPAVVGAIAGSVVTLIVAVIGAVAKFSINRATATKISTDAQGNEANTAQVFSKLAAEWTKRADERVRKLEERIGTLVGALEVAVIAIDNVAPLLEQIVDHADSEAMDNIAALRTAARTARRLAL